MPSNKMVNIICYGKAYNAFFYLTNFCKLFIVIIGIGLENANFVNSSNPWFKRSGNYNNSAGAGAFYFNNNTGGANTNGGFRVVLAYYYDEKVMKINYFKVK